MKKVAGVVAGLTFLLLVGSMGALELNTIDTKDFLIRCLFLFPIFAYSMYRACRVERW